VAIATLDRLTYWYPDATEPAFADVDLSIDGGLTLVTGPSGGGKTSLLRVLNGLVPHFHGGRIQGRATVDGHDVFESPARLLARSVGFVFQDPELQAVYTVVDREVAFGLENLAVPSGEIGARIEEALELVGIAHLRGRRVATLSGGERQRLALASVMALRPRLVVLDEPTSQLDPEGTALTLEACRRLADTGRAVVVAEHRLAELMPIVQRALRVEGGRLSTIDPSGWRPPTASIPRARAERSGILAWSLDGVAAGFDGTPVLSDVDLHGMRGEVVALTGPNGGGKTTLMRVIAGALRPRSGTVERAPGRIAYLPQNPISLLHRPTVLDEVRLTLNRGRDPEPPEVALEAFGLLAMARRYPRDLSSGERQRAALAAILAGSPQLVLLDEPTRGMDAFARGALTRTIERMRDRGAAVVIATHDTDLCARVADRVLHVGNGRVTEPRPQVVPV
jgi:energy-coupling factor transporter ATP-binding protein EcfA2